MPYSRETTCVYGIVRRYEGDGLNLLPPQATANAPIQGDKVHGPRLPGVCGDVSRSPGPLGNLGYAGQALLPNASVHAGRIDAEGTMCFGKGFGATASLGFMQVAYDTLSVAFISTLTWINSLFRIQPLLETNGGVG